jgi:hypothetical protein
MSLDFDALRKKLQALQGQNRRSTSTWKPSEGKSVIRIVPWKDATDNPFVELYFHYIGGKTQLSPITHGDPDPLVEFAEKLRATGDKDDWQRAIQFFPKRRTFAPIIVRNEEEAGVRFWGFGKTVYMDLLGVIDDPEWGDITDVQTGHDIGIDYVPQDKSDTNFAKTFVRVSPKEKPLTKDADLLKKWLEEQPDIFEVFKAPTYEELETFLEHYLNPEADPSVTAEELTPLAEVSETEEEGTQDIKDAFEDLFEDKA